MRNDTGHQLYKFHTHRITNSKMADKMVAVQSKVTKESLDGASDSLDGASDSLDGDRD